MVIYTVHVYIPFMYIYITITRIIIIFMFIDIPPVLKGLKTSFYCSYGIVFISHLTRFKKYRNERDCRIESEKFKY